MITIENLSVGYTQGVRVIDSLSITLNTGLVHGMVGLNGAGKTTLLSAIYELRKAFTGKVLLNGEPIHRWMMAFLPTESYFYPNITGEEYLNLFKGTPFDTKGWNTLFRVPLTELIETYSSGTRKKLAIMGVIKQGKPIMILDEPFNNLDMEACSVIMQVLQRMSQQGVTIIITSHIIQTLTNLCDFIHYLEGGRITYSRPRADFEMFEGELLASIATRNQKAIEELLG